MARAGILERPNSAWTNTHKNFTQQLVLGASFKLFNPPGESGWKRYRATTKNLQWLIENASLKNFKIRALGRGWSFSKVGVTNGGLIDTLDLNFSFPIGPLDVSLAYANNAEDLYFLQCGTKIHQINTRLAQKIPQRSIKASGASNGQTIAGALSTGTHGAAFKFGAVHDSVVGLHMVTGANKHIWIERLSYPVASDAFTSKLAVDEVIKNDALFNAALISFGSFGFIHGVMIETEPQFLLEEHRVGNIPYAAPLKKAMTTLDFSDLNFKGAGPGKALYHFEVLFNLHNFESNNPTKGAFIKYMYKKQYRPNDVDMRPIDKFKYGNDLLGIISTLLDSLPILSDALIPPIVNLMFKDAFRAQDPQTGTLGQIFNFTKFRGQVASVAMGISIEDSTKALELIIDVNKNTPFPGGLSLRYVKGTAATLGFTKFTNTCVLEMDGLDGPASDQFFTAVWKKLEENSLAYTLHWGKINFNLNKTRIRNMYSTAKVDAWIDSRNELLSIPALSVFTNAFMEKCELDKIHGAIV